MSAPTDYTLLLLYKNYMYKHINLSMPADNIPSNGLWDYTKPRLFVVSSLDSSVLHNKLNLYIAGFFLFWY